MQVLIGGDLVPTKSNVDLFNTADLRALIGDALINIINEADARIYNLEVPLCDNEQPIAKQGPNLRAPTSSIEGIKALNPSVLALANNHILDQGVEGLKSTEDILNRHNIPYVGVGNNLFEAARPYILNKQDVSVGIYACAEHEFSIATETTPGANPFDPLETPDHIAELKKQCDYVIVLYHGGKEHYRYPSPYLQKVCRKMAQKGADLIICQHSHCIGCFEIHENSTIVYGQGNFIFDRSKSKYWKDGLLLKVNIGDSLQVDYIPIVKKDNVIRLADMQTGNEILNVFYRRSKEILEEGFIKRKYEEFAQDNLYSYLRVFSGLGKWLLRLDRRILKGLIIKRMYDKKRLLAIQNYIECEAHRDLIITGIRDRVKIFE